ncbi:MAG TPA: PAS domain-containing protein [Candidatus Melainabacteria bacterium]|jgi:two-component system, LuxR family, sensor kinase FixL|nr:PAS domain-containing protein [Candidatus Melainabacteria bacterium]
MIENAQNAVFAFDKNLIVNLWNPKAEELFGYSAKKAIGAKLPALLVAPDNRDSFEDLLSKFVKNQDSATQNKLSKLTAQTKKKEELQLKMHIFAATSGETSVYCVIVANTAALLKL